MRYKKTIEEYLEYIEENIKKILKSHENSDYCCRLILRDIKNIKTYLHYEEKEDVDKYETEDLGKVWY